MTAGTPVFFVAQDSRVTPAGLGGGTLEVEPHRGAIGLRVTPAGGRSFVLLLTPADSIELAARLAAVAPGGQP